MIKLALVLSIALIKSDLPVSEATCSYGTIPDVDGKNCRVCGENYFSNLNVKIVGGVKAVQGSWPATAYIKMNFYGIYQTERANFNTTITTSCQGTLIDEFTVLTAAQCMLTSFFYRTADQKQYIAKVDPYNPNQYEVFLGVYDISSISGSYNEKLLSPIQKLSVKNVIIHPSFDENTYLNDIAILQLNQPAELDQYVQIACLPNKLYGSVFPSTATSNVTAFAMGWGSLQMGGEMSNIMNNVKIYIYPDQYCQSVNFDEGAGLIDGTYQLCAGSMDGGKDTCEGDGGGSIFVFDANLGKYVAVGITSYGVGCGNLDTPAIYTRISAYSDWIQSYMGRKINNTMPFIPARSSASKIKSMGDILAVLLLLIMIVYQL